MDPETFPGVAGNCDMNKLCVSLASLRGLSGLEEDDVAIEDVERFVDGIKSVIGSDTDYFFTGSRAAKFWSRQPSLDDIAKATAVAVVAILPPGGAPIDLDVLADLIVAKMGGKLVT